MTNQTPKQAPQDILISLRVEAARQSQLLAELTEATIVQSRDIKRMCRVIVMIGWLIIIAGVVGFAVWIVNSLSWYWGF
jgi:hypothetical protein